MSKGSQTKRRDSARARAAWQQRVVDAAIDIAQMVTDGQHDSDMLVFLAESLETTATAARSNTMEEFDRDLATRFVAELAESLDTVLLPGALADAGLDDDPLVLARQGVQRRVAVEAVAGGLVDDDALAEALRDRRANSPEGWSNLTEDSLMAPRSRESAEEPVILRPPAEMPEDVEEAAEGQEQRGEDGEVIDAEVASTEIVPVDPSAPVLIEELGNGQRTYRVPGGWNPRASNIGGYGGSITPNRPRTHINTSSPHLGDQR